jgi:lysophospholipase L1-like esterase
MNRRDFIESSLLTFSSLSSLDFTRKKKSMTETQVINAGVGGNNTADLLERIEKDCLSHQPDLTILMAGTNDMNSKKFIPLPQYDKNMRSMVQSILKIKSHIVLMNLLPVYEPYLFTRHSPDFYQPEGHEGRLLAMNATITKMADDFRLSFLDIHFLFKKIGNVGLDKLSLIKNEANSNTTDGLHPTAEGYRVMGLAIYDHIISNRLSHSKIVCFGDSITFGDGSIDAQSYPAYLNKLFH